MADPANKTTHFSDCAIYNGPAYEPGPCDCGVMAEMGRYAELHRLIVSLKRAQEVQHERRKAMHAAEEAHLEAQRICKAAAIAYDDEMKRLFEVADE